MQRLQLVNGAIWEFIPHDEPARQIATRLAEVMQLAPGDHDVTGLRYVLHVTTDATRDPSPLGWSVTALSPTTRLIILPRPVDDDPLGTWPMLLLTQALISEMPAHGGILLHGALIERNGCGVILAGAGGVGKSTACQRLRSPWRAVSDDLTVVIPDAQGNFWAHPWPTWSRFMFGGSGGTWPVQQAIPLQGVCLLAQADEDRIEPVGGGQAVGRLLQSAEQADSLMTPLSADARRCRRLQRFESLCAMARTVPCAMLHMSLTGAFWDELETWLRDR